MQDKRILIVDDEPGIVSVVQAYLEREGFRTASAGTGQEALAVSRQFRPDLVVLDRMLPDLSGDQVCKLLRAQSDVPILMLTARTEEDEIIEGLALGADDYVTKPFSPRELLARVWALLRRAGAAMSALIDRSSFNGGRLVIDHRQQEARVDGRPVPLTRTEWDLLVLLSRQPGRVWSREELIYRLRGEDYLGDDRVIDAHIRKLRTKIEPAVGEPQFIVTVWGTGYKFGGKLDV